ncbi:MAG: transmembrane protein EpsH [Puniceicoccaceae bacterium 5H]|nr:MAG: transmembrane protein EpsH [Puniceicoccaceae bacterium 5H]
MAASMGSHTLGSDKQDWRRWALGAWLALLGLVLFQWWANATRGYIDTGSVFYWWMSQWFNDGSDSEHGPLVLLLALYLLYHNLRRWSALDASPRVRIGVLWLLGAVALNALGYFVQETRLNILAVLAWLQGMAWWLGGARWGRAAGFPLLLMLFSIPLNFVQDLIGAHLRYWVIASVHGLTDLLGLEIQRVGTVLSSPGRDYVYDVAPACSGIRSLLVVGVLSLVAGYFVFRRWWRRGLLLALALPFAFVGNLLRVLLIVLAGHFWGAEWGRRVHDYSGLLVFGVVLGLALLTAQLLERCWPEGAAPDDTPARRPSRFGRLWPATAAVTLLLLASIGWLSQLGQGDARLHCGVALTEAGQPLPLPTLLDGGWMGRRLPMMDAERQVLPADTGFARALYRRFNGDQVLYSVVVSGADRSSIHRPEICLRAQGWEILRRDVAPLGASEGAPWEATLMLAEREQAGSDPAYALLGYWFVSGNDTAATHWQRRWLDLRYRLGGEAHRWAYVLVQTPLREEEVKNLQATGITPQAKQRLAAISAKVAAETGIGLQ